MHLKNSSYCKTRGNAFQCDQRISFIVVVNCFRLCSLFYFSDEEDWIPSNSHHSNSENCKDVFGNLSSQTSVSIREIKPDLIPWRTTHIILLLSVPFHKVANSSVREKYKKKISRSQNHCVILPFSRQTNVTLKVRKEKKTQSIQSWFWHFLQLPMLIDSHISLYVIHFVLSLVHSYQGIIKIRRLQVQLDTLGKLGKMQSCACYVIISFADGFRS